MTGREREREGKEGKGREREIGRGRRRKPNIAYEAENNVVNIDDNADKREVLC